MNLIDHRRRVDRLLRGERNVTDLDRLFSDLRSIASDRAIIREIGDFSAHRSERDKGIVMKRAAEMQLSPQAWFRQINGQVPTLDEAKKVAEVNLKIAPDQRIMDALGMTRQQARSHFGKASKKLAQGKMPRGRQEAAFNWLAGSFVWETAFNDDELIDDFADVLIEAGALDRVNRERFILCKSFVALYALSVMHMSRLLLPDGSLAPLRLMVRQETGTLRIKANIPVADIGKPVTCAVSVFETSLDANMHSEVQPEVGDYGSEMPIEIGRNGKIQELV
ncbi:hypothetical protein [Martelella sp. AMO21009]